MPGTGGRPALAQAANGVVTPLYADRHVLRAEDLTLDQDSSDAALARLRRLLHGWGVVAGLVPVLRDDELVVTPGYAVTPSGAEVWLPDPLAVDRVAERVDACCGPDRRRCELPDGEEPRDDPDAPVAAWLVARAVRSETTPRAGVPVGCEHPASRLRPSRRCDGVALELRCSLPDSLEVTAATCDELSPMVCGGRSRRLASFDLPLLPPPEDDVVVLGRLRVRDGAATLSYADRRHLLPLSVLQAWATACVCPLLQRQEPEEPEEPEEPGEDEGRGGRPRKDGWAVLADRLRANGFDLAERPVRGRLRGPRVLVEAGLLAALQSGGVEDPQAFLAAEPAALSGLTGLSVDAVLQAQAELAPLRVFFRRSG
jgi:hypothetical protein